MTPAEKNVVKSLVAVAWADGKLAQGEFGVIVGLLCGFDANAEEEREILEYARTPRSLKDDIPLDELGREERELLFSNAALLTVADGDQAASERATLRDLAQLLGFGTEEASRLLQEAIDADAPVL